LAAFYYFSDYSFEGLDAIAYLPLLISPLAKIEGLPPVFLVV
jgi:hypothetical protein